MNSYAVGRRKASLLREGDRRRRWKEFAKPKDISENIKIKEKI